MSSIQDKIQQAASQNASLLGDLQETDSALSQLQQQDAYINDLNHQIAVINKRVEKLKKTTAAELQDHEKYRDSTMRRFAHKATGRKEKFAEKAAKEEKEYFDAMQAQKSAEDELTYVQHLKSEAENTRHKYASAADRHKHLQAELDALYTSIFAGHTPGFPDEDRKEDACNEASQHLNGLQQCLQHEKHILFLLGQTACKLSEARNVLDSAYGMSQYDMFGGGTMASMQKRNYLERAESAIQQVRMLQGQIKHLAPDIENLGPLNIAMGSIWSDVVFDNIFTDMNMHEKIKNSMAQVERAGGRCGDVIRRREDGLRRIEEDVRAGEEGLRRAREELQTAREDAFSRVLGGEMMGNGLGTPAVLQGGLPGYEPPSGPPPGYSV
ncbi:hypothetical protein BDU57DRAFT_448785 [Ampelomyces quisqualis]|uniref:Uncharacterized protein n=1 Tax=Ampelomyces quisqualis TaxID=50730 RepID=A0A6A5QNJ7_AMPQU|nr:hypothetical protein BDU57DRAFT_448785 [Ampelomyces quisqualis]